MILDLMDVNGQINEELKNYVERIWTPFTHQLEVK